MHADPDTRSNPSRRLQWWLATFMLGLALALGSLAHTVLAQQQDDVPSGLVLTVEGAIGPATKDYVVRGIRRAEEEGAELLVIRMDTPGGLMSSTRDMIKAILASEVPVATWVSPAGARAASAGTYILYGSHIAAMASATHLGSATPVQMGGMPGSDDPPQQDDGASESESGDEQQRGGSAMERKVLEDAVSYIRGLAERHGRNADWAEEAVREAVNLGASEALEKNVIDLVADDMGSLLAQLDGRTVTMAGGDRTLVTANMELNRADPDWRTRLLSVITNPNVAYFLMIIGFYGIIFELANPGAIFPGVIGAICLILALFAFQVLSINYAGLALILLGLAFIVGEAFMPSFGILGIGGIIAFVAGSIILMDGTNQAISLPTIGGTAVVAGGFILWTVTRFIGLGRKHPVSGIEQSVHERVTALDEFQENHGQYHGHVQMSGERWKAVSRTPVKEGDGLRVTDIAGLTVHVEPDPKTLI